MKNMILFKLVNQANISDLIKARKFCSKIQSNVI